jgi:hypothetical protein
VTATDVDAGDTLIFSITAGNSNGAFSIDAATGVLSVANAAALSPTINPSFTLRVQAQDSGGSTHSADITIQVLPGASTFTTFPFTDPTADDTAADETVASPPDDPIDIVEETSPETGSNPPGALPDERSDSRETRRTPTNRPVLEPTGSPVESSASMEQSQPEMIRPHDDDPPMMTEGIEQSPQLVLLRERAMWEALDEFGDQLSEDADRQHEEIEHTRTRFERAALAFSTGILALLTRASSLTAMALSSIPVWQRVDPINVLALSAKERKKRAKQLRDAEDLEDRAEAGIGDLLSDDHQRPSRTHADTQGADHIDR